MKKLLLRLLLGVFLILFVLYLIGRNIPPKDKSKTSTPVTKAENPEPPKKEIKDTIESKPIDYSVFEYPLLGSDYAYKVKITSIDTKIAKAAFTTKKDDYSVPEKADGYYLNVKFALTNPYEQEMMVPIPDYFYISSTNNDFFAGSTTFHRGCECKIDISTAVFNDKGKELWQFSEGKCGGSSYCVKFNPKETKNYTIKFTDPIFGEVRKLWFWGFNRHWERAEDHRNRDWVLVIDVDKKEVIGEEKL